jgi:mannose-6-phosphate isomerase-like protein (cupin superfamily)
MATSSYTHLSLKDVHDAAPDLQIDEWQEYRPATAALHAERTGVALQFYKPGMRQGFAHRHRTEEEVFVVLAGTGRVKLDSDIVELAPLDAIRIAPHVMRCWEGGPEGLQVLAFGVHKDDDFEVFPPTWNA